MANLVGTDLESPYLITDENGEFVSGYVYSGSMPILRLDKNGEPIYYLTDAMGSVIGLADGNGAEIAEFEYDSFGNLRNSQGNDLGLTGGDFRFQGQWLESNTDLYHFRARYYDPETGRFVSRDPVEIIEYEPESSNPYQFVYNNPQINLDPSGEYTISEINAAQVIDNILQNAQRLALQQVREQVIDIARGAAGELIKSALKQLVPFDAATGLLNGSFLSGNGFASLLTNSICELIPAPDSFKNRAWFEVDVTPKGYPQTNGFRCGENIPTPEEFTTQYGTYSLLDKNQNPRIDFIIKRGEPFSTDRKPPAYLSGDLKRSVTTIKIGNRQWDSMMNYAQPSYRLKNGNRGHQYVPITMYFTLFNNSAAHEKNAIKQALNEGIKLEIISFFDQSN